MIYKTGDGLSVLSKKKIIFKAYYSDLDSEYPSVLQYEKSIRSANILLILLEDNDNGVIISKGEMGRQKLYKRFFISNEAINVIASPWERYEDLLSDASVPEGIKEVFIWAMDVA